MKQHETDVASHENSKEIRQNGNDVTSHVAAGVTQNCMLHGTVDSMHYKLQEYTAATHQQVYIYY